MLYQSQSSTFLNEFLYQQSDKKITDTDNRSFAKQQPDNGP